MAGVPQKRPASPGAPETPAAQRAALLEAGPSPFDAVLAAAKLAAGRPARAGSQDSEQLTLTPADDARRLPPIAAVVRPGALERGHDAPSAFGLAREYASPHLDAESSRRPLVPIGGAPALAKAAMARTSAAPGGSTAPRHDKGLRHFSARVCAKVEEKGATTYNEVADELVAEMAHDGVAGACDHKNIRRRVYDALNVLMALDIIKKDKKDIRWLGVPDEASAEVRRLREDLAAARARLDERRRRLAEVVQRVAAIQSLVESHADDPEAPSEGARLFASLDGRPPGDAVKGDRLYLPFVLINAPRSVSVHCELVEDRSHYSVEFDAPFLINEDVEVLRLLGHGLPEGASPAQAQALLGGVLPADTLAYYCSSAAQLALEDAGGLAETSSYAEAGDDDLFGPGSGADAGAMDHLLAGPGAPGGLAGLEAMVADEGGYALPVLGHYAVPSALRAYAGDY